MNSWIMILPLHLSSVTDCHSNYKPKECILPLSCFLFKYRVRAMGKSRIQSTGKNEMVRYQGGEEDIHEAGINVQHRHQRPWEISAIWSEVYHCPRDGLIDIMQNRGQLDIIWNGSKIVKMCMKYRSASRDKNVWANLKQTKETWNYNLGCHILGVPEIFILAMHTI